jgi:hypothetical protein
MQLNEAIFEQMLVKLIDGLQLSYNNTFANQEVEIGSKTG